MAVFGTTSVGGGGGRARSVVDEFKRDDRVAMYHAMVWFDNILTNGPPNYDSSFSPYTGTPDGGGYANAVAWLSGGSAFLTGVAVGPNAGLLQNQFRRHIFWNPMGFPVVPPLNFPIAPFGITDGNAWMTDAYRDGLALAKAVRPGLTMEIYTGPFCKTPHELPGGEDSALKLYDPNIHTWVNVEVIDRWIKEVGVRGTIWMDAISVESTIPRAMAMRQAVRGIRIGAEAIPLLGTAPNLQWHLEWLRHSPAIIGWQHLRDNIYPNLADKRAPGPPFHEVVVMLVPTSDLDDPDLATNQALANELVANGWVLCTGESNVGGFPNQGYDMVTAAYAANGRAVPYGS